MSNVVVIRRPLKSAPSEEWNQNRPFSRQSSAPTGYQQSRDNEGNLASFLPSKSPFATVRWRNMDSSNAFYRTVRGVMSVRGLRGSLHSERSSVGDEDDATKEDLSIEQIKELPISMSQKRELNAKSQQQSESLSSSQRKYKRKNIIARAYQTLKETLSKFQIWQRGMKEIEGSYGTGVVAYFTFIKWLTLLNMFNFLLIFGLIVIPQIFVSEARGCSNATAENDSTTAIDVIQHLVQGSGFMECTAIFYGFYVKDDNLNYNIPVAYVLTILAVLLISVCMTTRSVSKGITHEFHEGDEKFYQYCNLVFGGWDFCINNEKAAKIKKILITNEIRSCLEEEELIEERRDRTKSKWIKLVIIRVVFNLITVGILGGAGYLIYFVFKKTTEVLKRNEMKGIEEFLFEFLPSMTIVCMNVVVPILFNFLVPFEKYSPAFTIFILLVRSVALRLASIIVFYASVYTKITPFTENWETLVGQQIYRLALTDFATHIILTFVVNFVRSLIAKKYDDVRVIRMLCGQNFELPKHVLDIVYTQMLCWLSGFYAPLLPGMFVIIFVLMFYIKKFACLVNSTPGTTSQRISKSKFMIILIVGFVTSSFPVLWTIGEMKTSENVGPFNGNHPWNAVTNAITNNTADTFQDIINSLLTFYFAIILLVVVVLLIAYYVSSKTANTHMTRALKKQLLSEGTDKMFLLEKLSALINDQRHTGRTAM